MNSNEADSTRAPAVTVTVCARNEAGRIEIAIESVLNQGRDDVELIVVDDHSTDATAAIARSYPGVIVMQSEGHGPVAAINMALQHASAPIAMHLDADDWFLPGAVTAHLAAYARDPAVDMVVGGELVADDSMRVVDHTVAMPTEAHLAVVLLASDPISHSAVSYRVPMLRALAWYTGATGPAAAAIDYDLWLRIIGTGARCVGLPEPTCTRRLHGASLTSTARGVQRSHASSLAIAYREEHFESLAGLRRLYELGRSLSDYEISRERTTEWQWLLVRAARARWHDGHRWQAVRTVFAAAAIAPVRFVPAVVGTKLRMNRRRRTRHDSERRLVGA